MKKLSWLIPFVSNYSVLPQTYSPNLNASSFFLVLLRDKIRPRSQFGVYLRIVDFICFYLFLEVGVTAYISHCFSFWKMFDCVSISSKAVSKGGSVKSAAVSCVCRMDESDTVSATRTTTNTDNSQALPKKRNVRKKRSITPHQPRRG